MLSYLLSCWTVQDDLAVLEINFEALQVPIIDSQHGTFQVNFQHPLKLANAVHLISDQAIVTMTVPSF